MPTWLVGHASHIEEVAGKAVLMYVVALLGLRVAHRRTLAQWTAIDFAAAVAVGAILGRTAVASNDSFLSGAVALITILTAHFIVTMARFHRAVAKITDHRVRVLVDHGRLRRDQLRLCGLTDADVMGRLRHLGVHDISALRYVLYETMGELTVVHESACGDHDPELVRFGLKDAAGYPGQQPSGRG